MPQPTPEHTNQHKEAMMSEPFNWSVEQALASDTSMKPLGDPLGDTKTEFPDVALQVKANDFFDNMTKVRLDQALNEAKYADLARQAEEKARHAAEKKLTYANGQVQQLMDYARQRKQQIQEQKTAWDRLEAQKKDQDKLVIQLEEKIRAMIKHVGQLEKRCMEEETLKRNAESKLGMAFEHVEKIKEEAKKFRENAQESLEKERKEIQNYWEKTIEVERKNHSDKVEQLTQQVREVSGLLTQKKEQWKQEQVHYHNQSKQVKDQHEAQLKQLQDNHEALKADNQKLIQAIKLKEEQLAEKSGVIEVWVQNAKTWEEEKALWGNKSSTYEEILSKKNNEISDLEERERQWLGKEEKIRQVIEQERLLRVHAEERCQEAHRSIESLEQRIREERDRWTTSLKKSKQSMMETTEQMVALMEKQFDVETIFLKDTRHV